MQAMEAKNASMQAPATVLPAPANDNAPPPLLGAPETPPPSDAPEVPDTPDALPEVPDTPPVPDVDLLAKARDWQASEYLPEEFLGKLIEVEIKLDDGSKRTELVTAKEMRDGYLRQSALSRAQTRIHQERQQMHARDQNVRAHFEKIRDPDAFLQEYEDRGYGPVLEAVAVRIAERRVMDRDMVAAAGIAAMQRYQCDENDRRVWESKQRADREIRAQREREVELRRIQAERDALASRSRVDDQQAGVAEMAATYRKQLEQLRPIAFKAFRVHDNPATQKEFARHLLAQLEVAGNYEITRDAVMTAARTLSEELADRDAARQQAPQPRVNGHAKPLSPTPQQGGRAPVAGAPRGRKRASDLMHDLYGKP